MVTSEWMGGTKLRTFVRGVSRVGTLCGLVAGLAFYTSCVTPPPPDVACETDADCADEGTLCEPQVCGPDMVCIDKDPVCAEGETCNTDTGECEVLCSDDNPCADTGDDCTDAVCSDDGVCGTENNTAACDDGDVCTDGDVCGDGTCGGAAIDGCCETDADCADGEVCTDNACAAGGCTDDAGCDDGVLCNGAETCDLATGDCVAGDNLCADGEDCDEETGDCTIPCADAAECDDGNECTDDDCVDGVCANTDNAADCDDFDACTSGDVCAAGVCAGTDDETCCEVDDDCDTGAGEICANIDVDTGLGTCTGGCVEDADCDDGDPCTTDTCVDGACDNAVNDVDNGIFCDGVESCDPATGDVTSSGDPCVPDTEVCDEASGTCLEICTDDAGCDDGLFCNGAETCENIDVDGNGTCAAGTDPCAAEQDCDEVAGSCECTAGVTGQTIMLSFGPDILMGDCGDDTFLAGIEVLGGTPFQTLDNNDALDGKTGHDRLNVQFFSAGAQSTSPAALTSIEAFDCDVTTGFAQTFNMVNADSVETINNNNSSTDGADLLITNAPVAPTAIGWSNGTEIYTVNVSSSALDGTNTCAITLSGIVDPGDNETVLTLQPSAAGSGYGTFNITSGGSIAQVVEQITDGVGTSLSTVNIDGGTKLTITQELDASVTTVNAGDSTGGVVIAPNSTGVNTTCTGGSGDDTFDFSNAPGDYTSTDVVAGGTGGDDTLLLDDADAAVTVNQGNVSGIDTIEVDTALGADIDITWFGATKFKASGDWNARSVTIPDGGSVEYDVATTGNITIVSKTGGTSNTMTLDLDTNVGAGFDLLLGTWEFVTLNIDNTAVTTGGVFTMATAAGDQKLTITGSQDLTLGDAAGDTLTVDVLDASDFTGTLVMIGLPLGEMTINGGSQGDTLIGSNVDADEDEISGNDGNDTIEGNDGNDVLRGGLGSDTFVFEATAAANNSDILDDFETADILNLSAFATDDAPAGTVADDATGNTATADNDIWLVTDADGSVDTAAEVAALFAGGGTAFGVGIANADVVVVIMDTQATGSSTIWYVDNDATAAIIAAECVQVATLSNFNTALVDANITD